MGDAGHDKALPGSRSVAELEAEVVTVEKIGADACYLLRAATSPRTAGI